MAIKEIDLLNQLDITKQLTFAFLTCERVFPNYVYFSANYNFGNPAILREAINFIYESIFNINNIDKSKVDTLLLKIHNVTPHTNNFTTFYATIAMYSGGVIFESINLFKKKLSNQIILDISTMSTDAIDCFIQERDDMDYADPNFEEKILNDSLMQTEVEIQKGVISYLMKVKYVDTADIATLLKLQDSYRDRFTLHS
jgi:uncharacterized protein YjaG (DUF416 family)